MNVPDHLRAALRDIVAPSLRDAGFRGSGQTWRLASAGGDVAVVNVQLSQWNTDAEATAYLNLAVLPAAWWAWLRESGAAGGEQPGEVHGLYRARLEPLPTHRGAPGGWECWDEVSARLAARDMRSRLLSSDGLPAVRRLLSPERFTQALRDGQAGVLSGSRGWCDVGLAVLLSDVGGDELDEVCDRLLATDGPRPWREHAAAVVRWARARARAQARVQDGELLGSGH